MTRASDADADTDADVIVVGGGVVGRAVARALAPHRDALVIDAGPPPGPGGATRAAAGLVTTAAVYADRPAVASRALAFFRAYDGHRGVRFRERPSLELLEPDHLDRARRRVDRLRDAGRSVAFLDREAVAARLPRLADDGPVAGAVVHPEAGTLDPTALAAALRADAVAAGARFRSARVEAVLAADGRVRGVRVDGEAVRAPTVVVAAGWATGRLLRASGLAVGDRLPVRPYRTFCARLRPDRPLPASFPTGALPAEGPYFRPTPGGDLLVGGWAIPVDPDGTGGAPGADPTAGDDADADGPLPRASRAFRETAVGRVAAAFEGFDAGSEDGRGRVANDWAGVDGATPDGRPVVDAPADAPDGLVVAAGFHGKGVMTAPAAAALAARIVLGETAEESGDRNRNRDPEGPTVRSDRETVPHAPFALDRFDGVGPDFAFDPVGPDDAS